MERSAVHPSALVRLRRLAVLIALLALVTAACAEDTEDPGEDAVGEPGEDEAEAAGDAAGPLTVYSGRAEELVGPILEQFTADTGIEAEIRYGDTAELAATILEEGENSPADVYFAQDAGALGALQAEGRLTALPDELLDEVDERFRSPAGEWIGLSGRARTLVYSTELLDEADVPDSVLDLTDDEWAGRVGWAPSNGSFQAFVTGMREILGEDETRDWLEGMVANDTQVYENNTAQVEAAGRGEIEIGLVNHYYLPRFTDEDRDFAADQKFLSDGDPGALVNIAGMALLDVSDQIEAGEELIAYLLSEDAQHYFAEETNEYPLVTGVPPREDLDLPSIEELDPPDIDLSDLDDLEGTLELLQETGALQ